MKHENSCEGNGPKPALLLVISARPDRGQQAFLLHGERNGDGILAAERRSVRRLERDDLCAVGILIHAAPDLAHLAAERLFSPVLPR